MQTGILGKLTTRYEGRKLFREYDKPFDHGRPPGPDNIGPYSWQMEFHEAAKRNPERLMMAANRVGKSRTAAAEIAIHATGRYPDWWTGRRFEKPVKVWTGAESTEKSRDVVQLELLGQRGDEGTGWIPRKYLKKWERRQAGVTEVAETVFVEHVTGGTSEIGLKTYAMEARGWTGESKDVIWCDELVPMDIYTEALTRLIDRRGIMLVTFTPLEGPGDVVRHFLDGGPGIYTKNVTWDDAPHLDADEKRRLEQSYPEWERDARTKGMPLLGTGAIFPIADSRISIEPFEIPGHWRRLNGIDFGMDHPGAGAFCALDGDSDTFYVYDGYKESGHTPVYHAAAMKKHGEWIPNAWPHDGLQREKGSNVALKDFFRQQKLTMLREFAQYRDARGNSREASLIEMYEYMKLGRFKVFSTCTPWFEEKRLYHRKDGKVVAVHDDLISASRYAFMMRRYATHKPMGGPISRAPTRPIIGGA